MLQNFLSVTITHNLRRFSEMIPWLKGNCTMMTRTSKGVKLARSMSTPGNKGMENRKESTNFGTFIEHNEIIGSKCPNPKCSGWLLLVNGLECVDGG